MLYRVKRHTDFNITGSIQAIDMRQTAGQAFRVFGGDVFVFGPSINLVDIIKIASSDSIKESGDAS